MCLCSFELLVQVLDKTAIHYQKFLNCRVLFHFPLTGINTAVISWGSVNKKKKTCEVAKVPESVSLAHLVTRKLLSLSGKEVIYYQTQLNVSHQAVIPHLEALSSPPK